jgi:hypothetical protein
VYLLGAIPKTAANCDSYDYAQRPAQVASKLKIPVDRRLGTFEGTRSLYDKTIRLSLIVGCALLFAIFAVWNFLQISNNLLDNNIWFNDFFGLWSYAKFLFSRPVLDIYNNDTLLDFQMDLGACPKCLLPFAYPPFFLLYIAPLGFLSYYLAYLFWAFSTLFLYFALSLDKQRRQYAAFLTIFAPATIICFATGQTGLLASALIVGGFCLVTTRPILSGTLFGLASFKPQLGILIPIALISAQLWRAAAAACVTVLILVLASGVAFGWSIWPLWFAKLLSHADWVMDVKDRLNPTITSSLTSIGIDLTTARTVQACVAVFVGVMIWVCFRRGVTMLATASLLAGTFLATPYAIVYDMPLLTSAVLLVLRDREQKNRALTIPELIVLAMSLVVPVIMVATWRPATLRSIPLILLFGLIVRCTLRSRSEIPKSL